MDSTFVKRVVTYGPGHDNEVASVVNFITNKGLRILKIKRVKRNWTFFGADITDIYYTED